MFQAFGVHGPELTAFADMVIDLFLVGLVFTLLVGGPRSSKQDVYLLTTFVVAVTALRVILQPLPNIQPVTVAALLVGAQLGARRGVAFAVLVTLLSNLLIGDGWWTLFQAIGWSAVAVLGSQINLGTVERFNSARFYLAAASSAFLFDFIVSFSIYTPGMSLTDFVVYLAHGLPFDILHALGNLTFAIWFGHFVFRTLQAVDSLEELEQAVVEDNVVNG
ncbi:MAG TPA: DUF6580 family putative transport protein [Poseidonia sp.]|nr:DUF6580 family putative transport protein [Poseidonia sp.]